MGLDSVELVMNIEDAFRISLPESELVKTVTPGLLTDLIFSEFQKMEQSKCYSQIAFYRLRQVFIEKLNFQRKIIRPDAVLGELLPKENRREQWRALISSEILDWPNHPIFALQLGLPKYLSILQNILFLGSFIFLFYSWSSLNFSVPIIFAFFLFSYPFRVEFPPGLFYFKDLIKISNCPSKVTYSRDEILEIVIKITSETLSIEREKINENSHFINDLGMD